MDFAPFPESALRGRRSELRSSPVPLMAEPRYLPPRRPARGAVLRASSVSSASFVSTFLQPCPSLARVTTRWTCSAVLAIFSGGGHSTYLLLDAVAVLPVVPDEAEHVAGHRLVDVVKVVPQPPDRAEG